MSNGNKIVENNSFHQKKKVAFYCEFEKVSSAFWGSVSTQVRKAAQCRNTGQSIRPQIDETIHNGGLKSKTLKARRNGSWRFMFGLQNVKRRLNNRLNHLLNQPKRMSWRKKTSRHHRKMPIWVATYAIRASAIRAIRDGTWLTFTGWGTVNWRKKTSRRHRKIPIWVATYAIRASAIRAIRDGISLQITRKNTRLNVLIANILSATFVSYRLIFKLFVN